MVAMHLLQCFYATCLAWSLQHTLSSKQVLHTVVRQTVSCLMSVVLQLLEKKKELSKRCSALEEEARIAAGIKEEAHRLEQRCQQMQAANAALKKQLKPLQESHLQAKALSEQVRVTAVHRSYQVSMLRSDKECRTMQPKQQSQANIPACPLCLTVSPCLMSWNLHFLVHVYSEGCFHTSHDRSTVTCNHNRHMSDDLVQVEGLEAAVDSKDAELITLRKTLQHKEAQV